MRRFRIFLSFLALLISPALVHAQGGTATNIRYGTSLPGGSCQDGSLFELTAANPRVLYHCNAGSWIPAAYENLFAADSGAANAYVIAPTPAIPSLAAGAQIYFKTASANTGASTINVNGLGVKNITKQGTTALANGDILAGAIYALLYDGTEWQLLNPSTSSGGGGTNYQTFAATGTNRAQEAKANFSTDFTLTDNPGAGRTDIALAATIGANTTGNAATANSATSATVAATAGALSAAPSATAVQGNGTKVQLSTGTTSTNDCARYDANGNTVDSGVPCASLDTTNILGLWKMDDGSGTTFTDSSGQSHNLSFCGGGQAPTWLAAPGRGAQFSGGQCATGGSALNSARTLQFFVEYQDNNDLNLFDAIIAGNGGSATSHTSMALGLTRQIQPSNILYGGKVPVIALNNGGNPIGDSGESADVFNATAVVTFELGSASDSPATFDRVFFNGVESKQYIGGTLATQGAGLQTSGVWSLGGIGANAAWPQSLYFNGNIRYAIAYSDYKNAAVVASNTTFINNAMAARGVPVAIGSTQTNDIVVVEGDSIEQNPAPPAIGVPGGPWPSLLQLSIPSTAGTASYGFVQAIGTVAVGNGTSTPHQVFPSNVTSGNALIGFFRVPHGATFTITDTLGNAWFPILDPITGKTIANVPSSGSDDYLYCSGAHASGANTVTLNESGGTNDVWIGLLEYSGTAASANAPCSQFVENVSLLVDTTTTVGTGSTTVPSGTVLAVSNPDLLLSIMFMGERPISYTPGSGYTARLSGGSNNDILASDTAASPVASGFYSTSSTVTTSFSQPGYVSFLIAMKASTSFAGSSFQIANHGIGGARLLNMAASGATSVCTMFHPNAARNFLIIDAGINDLGAGQTPVQVWQNLSYFGRQMKSCGFSVAVATMGSAFRLGASMDPQKNAYNGLIRGTPLGIAWDALFDKAADPCIGADVAYGGSCFSGDEIHPNQTGANHIGAINQRGVNDFYGNRTFTSATTYTASAPAAEADNHAILGASAGSQTFTERSCVGFTSQRLYRKNTDTHSWTLAADGSEKFDAASTLTVAAGAMVIIESTLTSPTAGGCRWTVIQNQ
jgi:hypothetical protein